MMLAPSFPMSSVDNNHLCPHCAKRFDRRDLKERHRRRCEKSINKVRIAKKRSCESCIASKVKCDLAKPCSRCRNRQTKCEYKIDEVVGHRNRVPQSSPPATAAISSAGSSSAGSSSASSSSTTFDFSGDMLASDSIDGGSLMPTTDFFDPQLWLAQDLVSVMPNGDLSIPMESLLDPDSLLGSFTQQSSPSQSSPPLTGYLTSSSVHATTPNSSDREIESSLRRYTLTDLGDPSLSVTWKEPNFSEQSSLAFPLALKLQEKHRSQFQTKLPEFLHDMLAIHPPLGPGLIDLERAEKMVADYPAHMLVDTFFSPFVHGRLVQNGMPEPVAIAVACVGMKLHTQLSGMEFVCNVFRVQREKIVAELPTVSQNLEDICAYIHAYSIYQIESLLSPNRYSAPLSSAELHHEYLVKMIRRLSKKYRNILTGEDREDQWEAWTIAETFRRTFYLVLLIHQLLGAREVLMPAYFEPLLSTEDLRSLQLPCTDELWLAQDRTAWCQAYQKEQNRHLSSISVGSMLDSLSDNESLNRGSAEQPPKIDQLGELPRLVISILKHTLDL